MKEIKASCPKRASERICMMKKLCLLIVAISLLGGCARGAALIRANSASSRTDVFEELKGNSSAPQGYGDVRVTATLKTHKPGIFAAKDIHGTPDYRLLVNIDGQALLLRGRIQKENSEPAKLVDPEAGDGVRYRFNAELRLKAGLHRVVLALPDDGIAVERDMDLGEGKNDLVLEPVYAISPGKGGAETASTNFREGISGIRVVLNGRHH